MLKALIIDDEHLARQNLKALLHQFSNILEIVGEANSVESGTILIEETDFDLVFLDINLSDGSGFNILENVSKTDFLTIFVTAYNDFAVSAFQIDALDYLMKPIDQKLLQNAIDKAKTRLTEKDLLRKTQPQKAQEEPLKLAINEGFSVRFVAVSSIIRCTSDNNYTEIFLENKERLVSARTLKEYDRILSDHGFFRIHQSHLINLSKIQRLIQNDGFSVEMKGGSRIAVSRRKKTSFLSEIKLRGIHFI